MINRRTVMGALAAAPVAMSEAKAFGGDQGQALGQAPTPISRYGYDTASAAVVDPSYQTRRIAQLKRWASGDFSDEERERETIKNWSDPVDSDIHALRSMAPNVKGIILAARARERDRQRFMRDAARQLAEQFGIKL